MGSLCTMHNLIQPIQLTGSHEPPDTVQFDVKKNTYRSVEGKIITVLIKKKMEKMISS